jgi:NadR type nicotinamide-nucleotide adenylyltransferase
MLKKVAIVGPEASGKTKLTEALARHYQTSYAAEYARDYLLNIGLSYQKEDLLKIAIGQLIAEDDAIEKASEFVFFDTNLLVIKIWSLFKYGSVEQRILNLHQSRKYDFYLLLTPDLVYEEDPLRENPSFEDRKALFKQYQNEIIEENVPFSIISGLGDERLKAALKFLDSIQ